MGFRDFLLSALGGVAAPAPRAEGATSMTVGDLNDPAIQDFLRGGLSTNSGASFSTDGALRVAAAWRCVNIIAGAVATLPLDIMERVDEKTRRPAVNNPLRNVLTRRPNHWQTPSEFRRMMQAQLLLRGNAYALKVVSLGKLLAMIPMHPDKVEVKQADDLSLTYVYTRSNGAKITLKQSDVFHLRGLSLDGVTGLSVISYAREALGLALQTEQAGARLFKQGVLATLAFGTTATLSPEAYDRLKASIDDKYSGVENAHKTILLEEGLEPKNVGMPARDAQFLETRDFQRYDVFMFFGVPPHMGGATEKTTSWGSGIEQQSTGFVQYTLQDWLTTWEQAIERDLIDPKDTKTYAKFFTAALLRGDVKTRWASYKIGREIGVYSPNDIRALEDQNPRTDAGGDEYAEMPNTAGAPAGELTEPEDEPDDDPKPSRN